MTDHDIAMTVNKLRDIAKEYGQTQQLRERIASVVVPLLSASNPAAPSADTQDDQAAIYDPVLGGVANSANAARAASTSANASPAMPARSAEPVANAARRLLDNSEEDAQTGLIAIDRRDYERLTRLLDDSQSYVDHFAKDPVDGHIAEEISKRIDAALAAPQPSQTAVMLAAAPAAPAQSAELPSTTHKIQVDPSAAGYTINPPSEFVCEVVKIANRASAAPQPSPPAVVLDERALTVTDVDRVMDLVMTYGDYRYAHCLGGRKYDADKAVETRKKIKDILLAAASLHPVAQPVEQTRALTDEQRIAIQECIDYMSPAAKEFSDLGLPGMGDSKHARCIRVLRTILTAPQPVEKTEQPLVDDLTMLIKKLVRHVRKASPDNNMADMALDYLRRHGLDGSPLRTAASPASGDK